MLFRSIVERDRHDKLLARDGLYASLYREQFSDEARGMTGAAAR